MKRFLSVVCIVLFGALTLQAQSGKKFSILIIDGQNNHRNWAETSRMMKGYLEETGLFTVNITTTPEAGKDMSGFTPDFSQYNAVVLNYNGDSWPQSTNDAFENFVKKGGGVVSIHAADNAFPEWKEYNLMIGLGGWGGRTEKHGPYVYYNEQGKTVRDNTPGPGGSHGNFHAFQVKTRNKKHPIMKGVPSIWMHEKDELYDRMRGPAENMTILATAYAAKEQNGSGREEPMMMTLSYGKGRVFHTTLGHANESQQCVGFITFLQRGTEWVCTGKVTQKLPVDFPTENNVSLRK